MKYEIFDTAVSNNIFTGDVECRQNSDHVRAHGNVENLASDWDALDLVQNESGRSGSCSYYVSIDGGRRLWIHETTDTKMSGAELVSILLNPAENKTRYGR